MFTVRQVQNSADLDAVLKLRFQVFTEEQGRDSLANFNLRTYGDDLDRVGLPIFCGYCSTGELVATLRLTPRSEQPFWNESAYELHRIHEMHGWQEPVPLSQIGRADRGVILPTFRKTQLMKDLYKSLVEHARLLNLKVLVGVIDATNERLCQGYEKNGWITYRRNIPFRDLIGNFITLDLTTTANGTNNSTPNAASPQFMKAIRTLPDATKISTTNQ